ncbi:hypothetical protein [Arthrobacter zhaoxinii]|uniref:hypothetical protein n=1 Tax=Arthrobacter zhaoxinii TaxID=2964616 RepID=UPI002103FC11|nr:hypothetical protein [Arthrobacter zhaoxinii]MCQ1999613.1 hypothetical protein [Arthrobacter zhaoxinii]
MMSPAEQLLEGPRGRRLCLELAAELNQDVRSAVFWLGYELDPGKGTSTVLFGSAGPDDLPSPEHLAAGILSLDLRRLDGEQIQAALQRSVDTAQYWQEPDGEDALAALPVIRRALRPLAERVLETRAAQRWGGARPAATVGHRLAAGGGPGAPAPGSPRHPAQVGCGRPHRGRAGSPGPPAGSAGTFQRNLVVRPARAGPHRGADSRGAEPR